MRNLITIERFIIDEQKLHPDATGDFSSLLYDISFATKVIASEVNKAGLADILGAAGMENIQGEQVQKLDEYANSVIKTSMHHTGRLCVMASEEEEGIITIPEKYTCGQYVFLFDPLDGSSNIDANVSIGSIFAVFRKKSKGPRGSLEDCLQKGRDLVAAGYVIYGSSTMFVVSTGSGVHGFTLDPSIGEFLLSHANIKTPSRGRILSINEGNRAYWDENTMRYVDYLKQEDPDTGRPYTSRYIGSLVADFHRNLLYGGIFLYPLIFKKSRMPPRGKLRLLYEAIPMAFICEQAGGNATDGVQHILDIEPTELHQRVPLVIGSREDVEEATLFLSGKWKKEDARHP
jgi:fructose-1,6-bisphosphatase I